MCATILDILSGRTKAAFVPETTIWQLTASRVRPTHDKERQDPYGQRDKTLIRRKYPTRLAAHRGTPMAVSIFSRACIRGRIIAPAMYCLPVDQV